MKTTVSIVCVSAFLWVGFGRAAPASAALPAVELAKMDSADLSEGWGEPQAEGEISYRTAAKGRIRSVSFQPWWPAESLRPPEDTVYVLEVRYKDTAAEPVIAYSYGALDRYQGPSEVHRFGGTADGKWKVANVAAGWDQIIRQDGKASFGFSSQADLPVASIRIRPAAPADEARHNAETRSWVAAVQAEKRKAVPIKTEPPSFKAAQTLGPVVAYAWSPLVPILPNAQPKAENIGAPIRIRMCLNEMEAGSFGVYANGADLTGVEYAVSELSGPEGKIVADVIPRTAEYALVQGGRALKWYPQRLWPPFKVDISKGQSHWFVFNLRTHRGKSKPGTYSGKVTITCDQGTAELPVEVKVLPIDLLTMEEAGLLMGGCVTGLVPAHDFTFATAYNQNGTNLWYSGVRPAASIKDDKLVLDFTVLDEWMAAAKKRGLKAFVWFLGGNPYGFPRTMTIFRDMAAIDTRAGNKPLSTTEWMVKQSSEANRDKPMPRERELVVEWCRQVALHAKEKDWPEVILTPFDEPAKWVQGPYRKDSDAEGVIGTGPWIKTYFQDGCAAIREGAPEVRIYGSIHHVDRSGKKEGLVFLYDIDVFCTNAIHEDEQVGDRVRLAGRDFWQYSGGVIPDQARYGYGFFFGAFNSRGSLYWAYNWGRGFDTTEGDNWMYAWHTPFDTIPAPSYEGVREAWDDRRVLETYKKRFVGEPKPMAVMEAILKEAAGSRTRGGRDTVSDFWTAVDDVTKLDGWRDSLLEGLLKAQSP